MTPLSRKTGRLIARVAVMTIVGLLSLWILYRLGFLNPAPIGVAVRRRWPWIALAAASLAGLTAVNAIRFYVLIRAFGVPAPFRKVLAANLLGQAAGQWLPGSLAVTELLRFGVMAGPADERFTDKSPSGAGPKGRLGLAIIVDRLLGLGAVFAFGGLAGLHLLVQKSVPAEFVCLVLVLVTLSLAAGLIALTAPFRPARLLQRLARRAAGLRLGSPPQSEPSTEKAAGSCRRAAQSLVRLLGTLDEYRAGGNRAAVSFLLSLAAAILNPLTLVFSSLAIQHPLTFSAVLASIPLTLAAVFLPTGIAGYGGPQLLAAGVFHLLGADPGAAVAACLLQNTIVLAVLTPAGAAGLALLTRPMSCRSGRSL